MYEWHNGKISLISSGQDSLNSYFLGRERERRNVFFGTHARLVITDSDTRGDVYDARICTTMEPCIKPASPREGLCEGDACSHPAPAPNDATPSSLTFSGPGDVVGEAPPPTRRATKRATTKCPKRSRRVKTEEQMRQGKRSKRARKSAKKSDRRAR